MAYVLGGSSAVVMMSSVYLSPETHAVWTSLAELKLFSSVKVVPRPDFGALVM